MLCGTQIVSDESAINGPTLLGDLVDYLEVRYSRDDLPVYTSDFEIGTGEFPIMSPIYKRMDMGDARYDLINYLLNNNPAYIHNSHHIQNQLDKVILININQNYIL